MALLKHVSAAPLSLGAPERPSARLCSLPACLPANCGAKPAALQPSAAVSVGGTRQAAQCAQYQATASTTTTSSLPSDLQLVHSCSPAPTGCCGPEA